ncbi:MAG TPA: NADH-quinone oxidoreductase subunit NuoE [Steroidobacteraceae bacterium]|jgi:NADH-quinone oxidoreductase subunit E|nr:NADH-quinone oxidoreductase subunit NuoE [Steroidobacteraceae bacterium]
MSTAEDRAPLAPQLTQAVDELVRRYEDRRAACIEALKLVQRHYRWVSDAHLHALARLLDMSAGELDAVATYYNLVYRRPVGRHVILLCDSVSCWLLGHEALCERLERRLGVRPGQTSADDRFTLLPIVCLGHCDHAPALMIDDDLHGDVAPADLDRLLDAYP